MQEGEPYSYILAPSGIKLFQEVFSYSTEKEESENNTIKLLQAGDSAPIASYEPGDFIHAVEGYPGQGAIFARSEGTFCQIRSRTQSNSNTNNENLTSVGSEGDSKR